MPLRTRLQEARENLGLTQKVLAELAGVSRDTIIRAEAGRSISGLNEVRLAKALKVERDWLFAQSGEAVA